MVSRSQRNFCNSSIKNYWIEKVNSLLFKYFNKNLKNECIQSNQKQFTVIYYYFVLDKKYHKVFFVFFFVSISQIKNMEKP